MYIYISTCFEYFTNVHYYYMHTIPHSTSKTHIHIIIGTCPSFNVKVHEAEDDRVVGGQGDEPLTLRVVRVVAGVVLGHDVATEGGEVPTTTCQQHSHTLHQTPSGQ